MANLSKQSEPTLEETLAALPKKERQALVVHERTGGGNISPTVQAQFFALYLNGKGCEEIQKLNPGFQLGAIVKAKVEGDWDSRLRAYQDTLFESVADRAKQTMFESVHFVSDLLAATHRFHGEKLGKYLQTGDPDELGELEIKSIGTYKTVLEMLLKLTGHDNQSKVQHTIVDAGGAAPGGSAPSSSQASQILAILAKDK